MAQPSISPHALSADFDHRVVSFPTRRPPTVPAQLPASSAWCRPAGRQSHVPHKLIRQVAVLEVEGLLGDVGPDLDQVIQLALAAGPRGVVCDVTAALAGADPAAVQALASAGRHVLDWPAIPVAVVSRDRQVRQALTAHPLGRHLIVTETLCCALSAVLSTPTVTVQRLRLAAHPTAPRASRELVTRALADLGLSRVIPCAVLVVSELVARSSVHAGTDIDVTLTWDRGVLRLTVATTALHWLVSRCGIVTCTGEGSPSLMDSPAGSGSCPLQTVARSAGLSSTPRCGRRPATRWPAGSVTASREPTCKATREGGRAQAG